MCSGLPVICSRYADGANDLVEDGKTGYIVDPFDEAAFSQSIETLLKEPKKARLMGKQAQRETEKFRFSCVAQGFLEAVQLALGQKQM